MTVNSRQFFPFFWEGVVGQDPKVHYEQRSVHEETTLILLTNIIFTVSQTNIASTGV